MHGSLLEKIDTINLSGLKQRIAGVHFHALADVNNPLTGPNGASIVFGPQKGATAEEAAELDKGMTQYAALLETMLGGSFSQVPGAGAAGGLGFGCLAYLGADISSGCEKVMSINHFDEKIQGAELILAGEGRLDTQSLMGKSLSRLLSHAQGIPVMVIAGEVTLEAPAQRAAGIEVAYSLKPIEETPLTPERVQKALFRVTYDALIKRGQEMAKKGLLQ
jgi:glycerate kinase